VGTARQEQIVSSLLRILQLRILWPILLLLAAFVVFFELIADAGGSAEPSPSPPVQAVPAASPTPSPAAEPAP
jgi:hypothetical protein